MALGRGFGHILSVALGAAGELGTTITSAGLIAASGLLALPTGGTVLIPGVEAAEAVLVNGSAVSIAIMQAGVEGFNNDPNMQFSTASSENSDIPDTINYDSKQVGKKYGEHMVDYPDMKDYTEYKKYADEIFKTPDQIVHDAKNGEYYYIKGNDLLRVKENGDFVSLYPGAESGRVINAIKSGGTVWP